MKSEKIPHTHFGGRTFCFNSNKNHKLEKDSWAAAKGERMDIFQLLFCPKEIILAFVLYLIW